MSTSENPIFRKLRPGDTREAMRLLDEHIEKHADGIVSYKHNWTDRLIAEEVNKARNTNHISVAMIAGIRQKEYGKLTEGVGRPRKENTNGSDANYEKLERRVEVVEERFWALTKRLDSLMKGFSGLANGSTD